ncbi:MAG TPA: MAPEG family protein [Pseudomonadales bacterium]
MNMPIITLLAMSVLPILCSWVSGYYRHQQHGEVDNKQPREQNARLTGAGARAVAAQANAWEALMVYVAALLAVTVSGVPVEKYASLTLLLLLARIAHAVSYIANLDIIRSLVFLAGYGICIYMFVLAL